MSISRPSLQTVKSTLQEIIHDIEQQLRVVRGYESEIWEQCDPADPVTNDNFTDLNCIRSHKRILKRQLAQLQRAQTEIKREISGDK